MFSTLILSCLAILLLYCFLRVWMRVGPVFIGGNAATTFCNKMSDQILVAVNLVKKCFYFVLQPSSARQRVSIIFIIQSATTNTSVCNHFCFALRCFCNIYKLYRLRQLRFCFFVFAYQLSSLILVCILSRSAVSLAPLSFMAGCGWQRWIQQIGGSPDKLTKLKKHIPFHLLRDSNPQSSD